MIKRLALFVALLPSTGAFAADPHWLKGMDDGVYTIQVWRSKSCGCCKDWIKHLESHNFDVIDTPVADLNAIKDQYQVPAGARSCHTAKVGDLIVEGHVPAQDIKGALRSADQPDLLAAPGMPSGSPGMDQPGARKDSFAVFALADGQVSEWSKHEEY